MLLMDGAFKANTFILLSFFPIVMPFCIKALVRKAQASMISTEKIKLLFLNHLRSGQGF